MAVTYEDYPKGKLAVDGGELQDCFDVSIAHNGNEKPIHTFRKGGRPSGSTSGARSADATFKLYVSRTGLERGFYDDWNRRKVKQLKFKVPGKTFVLTGRYDSIAAANSVDNPVEVTVSMKGADYAFA